MTAREPLHQAPNPDDLRRQPPRSSECAVVRGMLRDKKRDDAFAIWSQELRARAYVEMRSPPG